MNIETIMKEWQPQYNNTKAGIGWWNSSAEKFSAMERPTEENSLAMQIIVAENMLPPGASVLDVGSGSGRFSFALEAMGAEPTATDFSPKMIEQAEIRRRFGHTLKVSRWTASFMKLPMCCLPRCTGRC